MDKRRMAAKERQVKKMAKKTELRKRPCAHSPPGQQEVENFPVLDLGLHPNISREEWRFTIRSHVEKTRDDRLEKVHGTGTVQRHQRFPLRHHMEQIR